MTSKTVEGYVCRLGSLDGLQQFHYIVIKFLYWTSDQKVMKLSKQYWPTPSMMSQGETPWVRPQGSLQGSEGSFQGIFQLESPLKPL